MILACSPLGAQSIHKRGLLMPIQEKARVRAPEITGGRGWLNTDKPLSIATLRGKFILLDFWTYGCINCIHIIPDLKKLEAKYPNQLVVIGVHSAKFKNEKETEKHPAHHSALRDRASCVQRCGFQCLAKLRRTRLAHPGPHRSGGLRRRQCIRRGNCDVIDSAIAQLLPEFRKRGELNEQPLSLVLERAKVGDLPLAFPGKIVADPNTDRLFIADSNHNRLVVTKLDGSLIETIGSGIREPSMVRTTKQVSIDPRAWPCRATFSTSPIPKTI